MVESLILLPGICFYEVVKLNPFLDDVYKFIASFKTLN